MQYKIMLLLLLQTGFALSENLIDIEKIIPEIVLDIRYATTNNVTQCQIYTQPKCYLLSHVAEALKLVNDELKQYGYKLKIFDGYRPLSAQWKLWNNFPNPDYVSDPSVEFGRHTRGTTVDITLINLDGSEVEMPTEFDSCEQEAGSDYPHLPENIIERRELLKSIMRKHGFTTIKSEWWHFDFQNWNTYPPLDLSFEELS